MHVSSYPQQVTDWHVTKDLNLAIAVQRALNSVKPDITAVLLFNSNWAV